VRNFGASGYTLQKAADLPYWQHKYFSWSTRFNPDIVLIMLGSNDTKVHNWRGLDRFLQDFREMLDHYRSLASRPAVFLMTPPKQFVVGDNTAVSFEMSDEVAAQMSEAIRQLGQQEAVPVIDIRSATAAHPEFFASDGVHASADGLKLIAELCCRAVLEHYGSPHSREA
jgi:lysophospholipase L1-like esterase